MWNCGVNAVMTVLLVKVKKMAQGCEATIECWCLFEQIAVDVASPTPGTPAGN